MISFKNPTLKKPSQITLLILGLVLLQNYHLSGQTKINQKVSRPEKCWALWHPFKTKMAKEITQQTLMAADSLKNTTTLDGDISGGQLDAFKHALWMASLTQQMHWRKAWKLGKAHEKGNYLSYKKGKKMGKQNLPDKVNSDMDCFNNLKAIEIGRLYNSASQKELIHIIIDSIQAGKFRIIKKNLKGQFLDTNNQIIPLDSLIGRWNSQKTLVPSDYKLEAQ
jgi:hypothetical protein